MVTLSRKAIKRFMSIFRASYPTFHISLFNSIVQEKYNMSQVIATLRKKEKKQVKLILMAYFDYLKYFKHIITVKILLKYFTSVFVLTFQYLVYVFHLKYISV